jgi:hypothetical protein
LREAPISEGLRSTLAFIGRLTLTPEEVGSDDVRSVYEAGVSEQALVDAITVCFHFNMVDRVADSLGFDQVSKEDHMIGARQLLRFGYDLPGPLRRLARIPTW